MSSKSTKDSPEEKIVRRYHQQHKKKRRHRFGYKKTPTQFQMEVSECGAASLSMIMQYYGKYVPLEELRVETGVSRSGCNAKNIYLAAEHYGMKVEASNRSLDRMLEKNTPPCMLHWNFSHFVVFEGVKGKKFYINDPERGRRVLNRAEMLEGFSGTVLQFTPTKHFRKDGKKRSLGSFVFERIRGQQSVITVMLLLGIALIVPGVLSPVFSQVFADNILMHNRVTWVKWLLLLMILTTAFDAYFTYIQTNISLLLKSKMSLITTDTMIGHMMRLPMEFFEQRYAGDLVGRIYNNVSVSSFLSGQLVNVAIGIMTSVFYLVIMIFYSPRLSLMGVSLSVLSTIIAVISSKKITSMTLKYGMDMGKLYGYLYNGLDASASLKAAGAESEYVGRLFGYYTEVNINDQKLGRLQTTLDALPAAIGYVNTVVLMIFGSKHVIQGTLTPGGMMAFSGFLAAFTAPFGTIISFVRNMQQVKNDMARVEDIMRYKEDESYTSEKNEEILGGKLTGRIDMEDVSFAYGKLDEPFIRDFNLHVESGHTVALVGASGCGKSTISKMLSSLYKPRTGEIRFDDIELQKIPQEVISSSVSVVTQQISLFDGTIYDNITTWNKSIKQEDVIQAAKDACIHEEIAQKSGAYDYLLKENGSNISGGQRQRIEIAKALAVNPTILIMDEATSSLDAVSEKTILDNIKKRNCSCVVVAQRLSTIRDCDEIIVMDRGRIAERGTHEELLEMNGLYAKLIRETD